REDAKFCKSCGQSLHSKQTAAPEQVSASAPAEPVVPVSPAPASEEGVQPAATNAPSQPEQGLEQPAFEYEDPALAPTLILSPEKVLARHSRSWNQPGEALRSASSASGELAPHPADQPTVIMQTGSDQPAAQSGPTPSPLADQPTMEMPPMAA